MEQKKISGRWSDQEKYAFEEGLKEYGRGNWRLFLPIIKTKTQLQIRQHVSQRPPLFDSSWTRFFWWIVGSG